MALRGLARFVAAAALSGSRVNGAQQATSPIVVAVVVMETSMPHTLTSVYVIAIVETSTSINGRLPSCSRPAPWDALDLPFDEMRDQPGVPRDREARPDLELVLALRRDRMVHQVVDDLDDQELKVRTEPVVELATLNAKYLGFPQQ